MNYPYQMYPYPAQMNPQNGVQQIQNGGFVSIPSESMVNSYPVAPGNCVTFKVEGKPIVMEKSMGFSQLEAPKIERYRLVKEEAEEEPVKESNSSDEINNRIDELKDELDELKSEVNALKAKKTTTKRSGED